MYGDLRRPLSTVRNSIAVNQQTPTITTGKRTRRNGTDLIPCNQFFDEINSSDVRRWLASMTIGELSNLSRAEIRQRILRDCGLNEDVLPELAIDIDRIVVKRNQVQQLYSTYA